jgi:hypothetical protein
MVDRGTGVERGVTERSGRDRRLRLRRKEDRIARAAFLVAGDAWRQYRPRLVTGYIFVPLTTDRGGEEVWVSGRPKPYTDVGSLVGEAGGAPMHGRATRFSIVGDGDGSGSLVMGASPEEIVGLILTRSDRSGVTIHGRTLTEAEALDLGYAVPNARPVLTREEVWAFKRELRREGFSTPTSFDSAGARRRGKTQQGGVRA